ncbi:MAG: class I SAM-dependent methyltransferase [Planctomycetes bacterium]|nr:class I SAM-dependent methyltransferase [Planctomycetota bacterium]
MSKEKPWFANAFGDLYTQVYAHRNKDEAIAHLPFLYKAARLGECEGTILDLGCGTGRYSSLLKAKGHTVIGLDYSADLLTQAKQSDPNLSLIRGDMRHIPFVTCFSRILSLFTSFGYFADDNENEAVIQGMGRALNTGGILYLDYLNPKCVASAPWSQVEQQGFTIKSCKNLNSKNMVVKKVIISKGDEVLSQYEEQVKLYGPEWFQASAAQTGLELVGTFGDYQGRELKHDSPRCIYTFRKVAKS